MTSYRIIVKVDPIWVEQFRDTKINLCSAFGITTNYSDIQYDIIATSEEPTPLNTITWIEEYSIAASKTSPKLNSYVFSSTPSSSIDFSNSFTVSSTWTSNVPGFSALAPKNGFLFVNEPSATAILFKRVLNSVIPIYITSYGSASPQPPGQHTLKPSGKMLIFFMAQEARTTFRVEAISTKYFEFSYVEKPRVFTVLYNKDGLWEVEGAANTSVESILRETKL